MAQFSNESKKVQTLPPVTSMVLRLDPSVIRLEKNPRSAIYERPSVTRSPLHDSFFNLREKASEINHAASSWFQSKGCRNVISSVAAGFLSVTVVAGVLGNGEVALSSAAGVALAFGLLLMTYRSEGKGSPLPFHPQRAYQRRHKD
jgi:hypothetical protein